MKIERMIKQVEAEIARLGETLRKDINTLSKYDSDRMVGLATLRAILLSERVEELQKEVSKLKLEAKYGKVS